MNKHQIWYVLFSLVGIVGLYQNCTKKTFSQSTFKQQGLPSSELPSVDPGNTSSGDTVPIEDVDDEVIEEIITNCETARNNGALMKLEDSIIFQNTRTETGRDHICEFGENDNLDILNEFMRARYEQKRKLQLPENAVICDLDMTTQVQRFKYDDVFIFSFNNHILATNNKTALLSTTAPATTLNFSSGVDLPIYKYDWLKLRGAGFENVADDFCLGSAQNLAQCSWPISEQDGNIVFDFDQKVLIALGLTEKSQDQNFSFVITGDNDRSSDCFHEQLEFKVNVDYYIAPK